MKIKVIIIALGLIVTMISGMKLNDFNTTNEVQNINTVAVDEGVVESENIAIEDSKTETKITETEVEIEKNEVVPEEKTAIQKETSETISSQTTSITSSKTEKTTQETTQKKEENKTSVVEKAKEETPIQQTQKTMTPDDLEYWCVGGGTHHIAGDRENEHGYYSSWDEANRAFEEYTKGWSSVQYKIDTCSCGKYYFWAIK